MFLLSPANCRGRRAQQVLSPKATFSVAARLRGEGVPIGELFAHMSGLYFRGKITYARKFGRAFVITPDQGLIPAETTITSQVLIRFADAEIDLGNPGYRTPLEQTARALGDEAGADAQFVLLGSIASEKYVQVLSAIFGSRLVFPADVRRARRHEPRRGAAARRRRVAGARVHSGHRRRPPRSPSAQARARVTPFSAHNSHTLMCGSISGGGVCSTLVGLGGFVTQIGAIALLTRHFGWPAFAATAVALELAALQNFLGHSRWTWRDRPAPAAGASGFAVTGAIKLPRPPRSQRISPSRRC